MKCFYGTLALTARSEYIVIFLNHSNDNHYAHTKRQLKPFFCVLCEPCNNPSRFHTEQRTNSKSFYYIEISIKHRNYKGRNAIDFFLLHKYCTESVFNIAIVTQSKYL